MELNDQRKFRKTPMSDRRPLVLREGRGGSSFPLTFQGDASYFSEKEAQEQEARQAILLESFRPDLGSYKLSSLSRLSSARTDESLRSVTCCQFSGYGKRLALGFGNGDIHVVHRPTGAVQALHPKESWKKITSIRFINRDMTLETNKFFASSKSGKIFMAELQDEDWNCSTLFSEDKNEIFAMDINSNNILTSAGKDAIIRQYDTNSEKLLQTFGKGEFSSSEDITEPHEFGHFKRICALKCSPSNCNILVSGGWDDSVKIWDVRCPKFPVRGIEGLHINGNAIDISDEFILCGEWRLKDCLHLVDMGSGRVLLTLSPRNSSYSGQFISSLQFLPGLDSVRGDVFVVGGTSALEIMSIKENMVLHSVEVRHGVTGVDSFESLIGYGCGGSGYSVVTFSPNLAAKPSSSIKETFESRGDRQSSSFTLGSSLGSDGPETTLQDFLTQPRDVKKSRPVPETEVRLLKLLQNEVAAGLDGSGPLSLIGEKLARYLSLVKAGPKLTEAGPLTRNTPEENFFPSETYTINIRHKADEGGPQ